MVVIAVLVVSVVIISVTVIAVVIVDVAPVVDFLDDKDRRWNR